MLQNLVLTFLRLASLRFFLIHSVIATPNTLQENQLLCDKDIFGTPSAEDCYQAMFWIPYMNRPAKDSAEAKAPRIFAEPQYLDPPFSAVKNAYAPKAIVQLPKIWKFGSCHIALVPKPYIKRRDQRPFLKAEFREKWSDIVNQVLRLRPCLQPRSGSPQGGYTPLIITQSQPAGLYLYTTQSRFNTEQMTNYMANGKTITPPNAQKLQGSSSTNSNLSGLGMDTFNVSRSSSSSPSLDLLSIS